MIANLSNRIAMFLVGHELVDPQYLPLLRYNIDSVLRTSFFALIVFLISAALHIWVEALSFTAASFLLRRRMGGWHAPTPWLCQAISVASVLIAALVVGPLLETLPERVIYPLSMLLDLFAFVLRPAYPPQLHFNDKESRANSNRKNLLVGLLALIQLVSFLWLDFRIVIYSSLGLAVTVCSVLLEKIIQRERMTNHE